MASITGPVLRPGQGVLHVGAAVQVCRAVTALRGSRLPRRLGRFLRLCKLLFFLFAHLF